MKLLVCAAGTIGDVHPLVGVAAAMRKRGHEVTLIANDAYAQLAQEAGVQFASTGNTAELEAIKQHPQAWTYADGWKVWTKLAGADTMRRTVEVIRERNHDNTVIATSYLSFGGRIAGECLRIPTATLHLNAHTIRSVYGVYAFPPPNWFPYLPRRYLLPEIAPIFYRKFTLWWVEKLFIDPIIKPQIEALRQEMGLPRLGMPVRQWWNDAEAVIGLFPDWWGGSHPDWPAQLVKTGFPFWDRAETTELSSDLAKFLATDRPVIVFTPGASSSHTEKHFAAFDDACQQLQARGIIITSVDVGQRSEAIRHERYVPFSELLPHVDVVIHHAGIGTSAHCLAAGKPQLVVPTLYNQPDTAERLKRLVVAVEVSQQRFTAPRVTAALRQLLDSPSVAANCAEWARRMAEGPPALDRVCETLEALPVRSAEAGQVV